MKYLLIVSLFVILLSGFVLADWQNNRFIRGDADQQDGINRADALFIVDYLFYGGPAPKCMDSADWNDDGKINIADVVGINQYCNIFPNCINGFQSTIDKTPDKLDCKEYISYRLPK